MGIRAVLAVLVLWAAPTWAQTYEFSASGNATVLGDESQAQYGANLNFDFEVRFRLGLLAREPVLSMESRYDIIGGVVTTPTFDGGEDGYETRQYGLLASELQERVRLYDMKVEVIFTTGVGSDVAVMLDAGHLPGELEWSFNVPGSPSWDELFYEPSSQMVNGERRYYDAESAKAIWRSGLSPSSVVLRSVRVSFFELHQWYWRNNAPVRYDAVMRANDRLLDGLRISYGYRIDPLLDDPILSGLAAVEAWTLREPGQDSILRYDARQWEQALRRAQERMDRLSSYEADSFDQDNHAPFRRARIDALRIVGEVEAALERYSSPDVDVDNRRERGRPPRFGEPHEIAEIEGECWIVESATQTPVRTVRCGSVIIDEMSLTRLGMWGCENGQAEITYHDPATDDLLGSMAVSCASAKNYVSLNLANDPRANGGMLEVTAWSATRKETYSTEDGCGRARTVTDTILIGTAYAVSNEFELGERLGQREETRHGRLPSRICFSLTETRRP